MKLKFKEQAYQRHAVEALVDCFAGQPKTAGIGYRVDPGVRPSIAVAPLQGTLPGMAPSMRGKTDDGFRNADLLLSHAQLLENMQAVQRRQNLPQSSHLIDDKKTGCAVNLDIEMETGTGKTYCYIRSMFELNKRYGWGKFIVVVPSIAIREGVYKSLQITAGHFQELYGRKARFFIYNSKQLHNLESFSSDAGINVMVINVQAFAARGAEQRRIYDELDDFQSRRPIDVIKANRPILILDEPQKMEGAKTLASLSEFNPLFIVRYSATHKTEYNKIHRLDALDAYKQKLVKKISVHGITVKGLPGTHAYLYLERIEVAAGKPPVARVEIEVRQNAGIKRVMRRLGRNDNLYDLSGSLDQYRGYVVADIDARIDTLSFINGVELTAGEAVGNLDEPAMRRIQIREAIRAHFDKEQALFDQGVKVLTLFFIDAVAKYRQYGDDGEMPGEYARIFDEEYKACLNETLTLDDSPYNRYVAGIPASRTHDGYFSVDKKTRRLVDPETGRKSNETEDVDAYDLILKNKERLLSFDEPVRFIFSHSALREGWDNPNVFVICTLKHSDNTISRRQEVGRGLRLAVNQQGDRMDDPATVHQINELTVIASESYKDFVGALQKDISESLSARPRVADEAFFTGKVLAGPAGEVTVTRDMAAGIEFYLIQNGYVDRKRMFTDKYHAAKREARLAELPEELKDLAEPVFQLIDSVFSDAQLPHIGDGRRAKVNPLNRNFDKKEFQALWQRINRKAAYTVHFDSAELVAKCVAAIDRELRVRPMQYVVERGAQRDNTTFDDLHAGTAFKLEDSATSTYKLSVDSAVSYDLVGNLAAITQLTRSTIATILRNMNPAVFSQYRSNPEDFITKAGTLINEQKATVIVEHIAYDPVDATHSSDIFTAKARDDFSQAFAARHHIYDYVFTDSHGEHRFVEQLDASTEVVVYAKLPKTFYIPTPVGNYSPDWAIAFRDGKVKHVFFVAETKGSMSSLDLRAVEQSRIECARRFFARITSEQVKYEVVDSYARLMELVA
ncbi:MAG: DEAD/DEAH box helicase family protein [Proteobacteria bacterium]|nr:DEAD/DEAH box helicase family protein [Pseudomonadota bacterium]